MFCHSFAVRTSYDQSVTCDYKMLKNILLFSTLFAAAYCSGELSVIALPDSLLFKSSESSLKCSAFGPMISACLGKSIVDSTDDKIVYIKDPFNTPDHVVLTTVKGSKKMDFGTLKTKSVAVSGSNCHPSMTSTMERIVEEDPSSYTVTLDLSQGVQVLEQYEHELGKITVDIESVDSDLLPINVREQIAAYGAVIKALSGKIEPPAVTLIYLSFESLLGDLNLINEANRCYVEATAKHVPELVETFGKNKVMVLSYATKDDTPINEHKRSRRATPEAKDNEDLNLAKAYDDNYPVIFNIILWLGVVIAFSLFAISYAIATMDPGRDSIIYRMTSTRIKKDN